MFGRNSVMFIFSGLEKWIISFGLNQLHTREAEEKKKETGACDSRVPTRVFLKNRFMFFS